MEFQNKATVEERLLLMDELSKRFFTRAHLVDVEGSFPFENIQDLIDTGYTSLTVPKKYGGQEITLLEMVQLQEKIAEGDGSTALSIGWHMGIIKNLAEKELWKEPVFKKICEEVRRGALVNGAATEMGTGSPTRGGKPETTAVKKGDCWMINGRKTFTTMSPMLDFFIVSATISGTDQVGNFLIPRNNEGVRIVETWDSIAMKGTGSHDLYLENVVVDNDSYVEQLGREGKRANGWLLHIPACYLGIAKAAKKHAIEFALSYTPNSINKPIAELPNVKQKIGEMELKIMQVEYFLHAVARQWDSSDEQEREAMGPVLGAVKLTVTNAAIEVVDLAMRIVGARSLSLKSPLQRYYRDVRAGLHNPPMDDMTVQMLSAYAIQPYKQS